MEEQAQDTVETEETQTEETSEKSDTPSVPESETSGKSAEEETESEETSGEAEKKSEEETFEKKVTSLAQRIADKSTKTITKQRDDALARETKLQEELNDKIFTSENEKVFQDEKETLGEDDANKRKSHREHIEVQNKDFRQRDAAVKAQLAKLGDADLDGILKTLNVPTLAEGIEKLSFNVRNYKIKEQLWPLLFPEDKAKSGIYTKYLKRFDKVDDMEDVEIVMEGIKEAIKGKGKPFVPDSSKVSGSGQKLRGDAALEAGLKEERKKLR